MQDIMKCPVWSDGRLSNMTHNIPLLLSLIKINSSADPQFEQDYVLDDLSQ